MAGRLTRAVVVGASSLLGKELVQEIGDSSAGAWDLRLLDQGEDVEGQLASAGDEAVVIQALSEESLSGADIVFFAGDKAVTSTFWRIAVQNGSAVVDLTNALENEPGFLVRSPWLPAGPRPDLTTAGVVCPHPVALMLGLIVERLERKFGSVTLAATVLEPASESGAAGVDELHQQTVSLLSFQEMPKAVFDAQVAFNVQGSLGEHARRSLAEARGTIQRHLQTLLGGETGNRVALTLLQAPVFHGYTVSAWTQLTSRRAADEVRSAVQGGLVSAEPETVPSNQAAVETGELLVSVEEDGNGDQFWLLMAADNLRIAARNAVAAAMELAALRPTSRVQ